MLGSIMEKQTQIATSVSYDDIIRAIFFPSLPILTGLRRLLMLAYSASRL